MSELTKKYGKLNEPTKLCTKIPNKNYRSVISFNALSYIPMLKGAFTSTETDADTETWTDKMALVPNGISVSVQCEHLHIFPNERFLMVSVSVRVKAENVHNVRRT